jgi:hypothetical protein
MGSGKVTVSARKDRRAVASWHNYVRMVCCYVSEYESGIFYGQKTPAFVCVATKQCLFVYLVQTQGQVRQTGHNKCLTLATSVFSIAADLNFLCWL